MLAIGHRFRSILHHATREKEENEISVRRIKDNKRSIRLLYKSKKYANIRSNIYLNLRLMNL